MVAAPPVAEPPVAELLAAWVWSPPVWVTEMDGVEPEPEPLELPPVSVLSLVMVGVKVWSLVGVKV